MRRLLFSSYYSRSVLTRSVVGPFMIALLLIYGVFLASKVGACAGGSDDSGYLNNARLLSNGQLIIEQRMVRGLQPDAASLYAFVPLGFMPTGNHQMMPTYPMGLPLMIMSVSYLTGWEHAADFSMVLNAVGSIIVLYFMAIICGLSRPLAFLASVMLGSSSIFISQSLVAMSDVPALAWCSLAIFFAMLTSRDDRWSLASGASVAMSVLIRPTDALVMVPVTIAIGLSWRRWAWLLLGGSPGAIFDLMINRELYGSIFGTGYGNVGGLFDLSYVPLGFAAYAQWLPVMLTPGFFAIFLAPFFLRSQSRVLAILAGWILAILGFYSAYFHTHENWTYMRFPLPAFGAIIILMLLVFQQLLRNLDLRARRIAYTAVLLFVMAWNGYWLTDFGSINAGKGEKNLYPRSKLEQRKPTSELRVISDANERSAALLYEVHVHSMGLVYEAIICRC